jgi:hypothetical protein
LEFRNHKQREHRITKGFAQERKEDMQIYNYQENLNLYQPADSIAATPKMASIPNLNLFFISFVSML